MDLLISAPLSVSSKPILLHKETEIKLYPDIEILCEYSNKEVILNDGHLILTNYRLVYITSSSSSSSDGKSLGWAIMLQSLVKIDDCSTMLSRSTRIRLILSNTNKILNIKFLKHNTGKEELIQLIQKQLSKKSWEQLSNESNQNVIEESITNSTNTFCISNAGVGGLLRKQERDMSKVDAITREALSDLDTLMKSAKDVVSIVERYAASLNNKDNASNSNSDVSDTSSISGGEREINEMETIFQNIGIISPVTKYSAGRLYHKELSKQLADFLLNDNLLKRMGSMATLPDIYCLYNRSRGTELVSPDDFLKASEILETLGPRIGLKFKKFKSGVLSIHLDELNETVILEKLLKIIDQNEYKHIGVNASIVSQILNVSLIVAKEQLLLCEGLGKLCRDETIEGVFFYPNLFATKYCSI